MPSVSWPRFAALLALALSLLAPSVQAQVQASADTLTLQAAIQTALDENYQAQIARNNVDIAANDYALGNAGFWPSLSVSAGYDGTLTTKATQQFIGRPTETVRDALSTQQRAGATLEWTVFDGLRRFATYNRLDAALGVQRADTEALIEAVLADVIVTYYDVTRQQAQIQVLEEAVAISEERLRIARLRRELGSASDLEVRQALVDLNADRAAVLRQEVTLANAKATLNRLLARRTVTTEYVVAPEIAVDEGLHEAALRTTAETRNPALQRARRAVQVAEWERQEIRAERLPTLDANLGYGYSKVNSESGFLQQNQSYDFSYGLSLSFDLFNGLNRRRRIENAAVRIRNAELTVEDLRAQLATEIESAFTSYRNRLDLVALEAENREAAAANVEVALEQFRLGEITSVELREVQEQLIQAGSRLLEARFEAKRAEVTLLRLSGQLQERYTAAP